MLNMYEVNCVTILNAIKLDSTIYFFLFFEIEKRRKYDKSMLRIEWDLMSCHIKCLETENYLYIYIPVAFLFFFSFQFQFQFGRKCVLFIF